MSFQNKSVFITGAASGLGRDAALAFAKNGAMIAVSDFNVAGGKETVQLIKAAGGEAIFIKTDVSKFKDVEKAVEKAVATFGGLDIALNNAGVGGARAPMHEYSLEEWDKTIAINQSGVFYGMKCQIPHLLARKGGVIVNTASMAGLRGIPLGAAYGASKHAVMGLTKIAAIEYAKFGVRVNAVCPVFTHSPMLDELFATDSRLEDKLLKTIPVRRYGVASDITNAILWLAHPDSSFVTGLCLPVDGGQSA